VSLRLAWAHGEALFQKTKTGKKKKENEIQYIQRKMNRQDYLQCAPVFYLSTWRQRPLQQGWARRWARKEKLGLGKV
jgi:hypothetical protein